MEVHAAKEWFLIMLLHVPHPLHPQIAAPDFHAEIRSTMLHHEVKNLPEIHPKRNNQEKAACIFAALLLFPVVVKFL